MPERATGTVLAVGVAVLAVLALGATPVAADAQAQPDPDCAGSGCGAVYVTDSGLTVYENDSTVAFGTFPDAETVSFQDGAAALSASGDASARLERAGDADTATCVGDVDATTSPVTVTRADGASVTLSGSYESVSLSTVDVFGGNTDLAYDASAVDAVRVNGLIENSQVRAVDASDGTELDSATVTGGTATFTDLPTGGVAVEFRSSVKSLVPRIESTTSPVVAGETLSVDVAVVNPGETPRTDQFRLVVDGKTRNSTEVRVNPGETERLTLSWTSSDGDPGEYDVAVATSALRTSTSVEVLADAAAFDVAIPSTNTPVQASETLTVNATVENIGSQPGTRAVTLSAGATVRDTADVDLAPGEEREVTLTWPTETGDAGTYTASVGDATTRVTVEGSNVSVVEVAAALSRPEDELSVTEVLRTVAAFNQDRPLEGTTLVPTAEQVLLVIGTYNDGGEVPAGSAETGPRATGDDRAPVSGSVEACADCPLTPWLTTPWPASTR